MRSRLPLRLPRAAAPAVVLAAALFGIASPAQAYVTGGRPWRTDVITYRVEAKGYASSVEKAATAWNRAQVGIRFEPSSTGRADVVVESGGPRCAGAALMGFHPRRQSWILLGPRCSRRLTTVTAVHEFGHVLGLDHERRRCARMNPGFDRDGTPDRCRRHSLRYWVKHPLLPDDIDGARSLYGG